MNVLICGKKTPFTCLLAERLNREKHEVYYISGSKASEAVEKGVFQQYDFEYQNQNIGRIVKSSRAELMIITGMCDQNTPWVNPGNDAQAFVSGISSLLMAAKNADVRRVIFISSIDIFEKNPEKEIKTDTKPIPESPPMEACVQAESLCREFCSEQMEINIMRLPQVTGFYKLTAVNDFCLDKTEEYLRRKTVLFLPGQLHSAVYYKDAVEAIMRLTAEEVFEKKTIYQLQGLVFTEADYVKALVKTGLNETASQEEDKEKTAGNYPQGTLAETDEGTLGLSFHYHVEDIAKALAEDCIRFRKERDEGSRDRLHLLPFLEAVVLAILAGIATYFMRKTWIGDSFDLYTLYVLLFGAVYGMAYGLLAGLLATIGMLIVCRQDSGLLETLENYTFFLGFLEYVLVGVTAGYMHDKYKRKTTALTEEKNYLSAEVSDLSRIDDNNIYVKSEYEKRLIGYENSLSRIYELTSQLDFTEPHKIMFQAAKVAKELLEVDDVAFYMCSRKSKYYRLLAATSEMAAACGKSLKYDEESFLYTAFEQKEIYKNRNLTDKRPTFAGAVYGGDHIGTIIMVWTANIHKVNLYESDMFALMCRLVEKAMARAELYEESLRRDSYIEETNIMREEAFRQLYQTYREGKKQGLFDYTMLEMDPGGHELTEIQRGVRDTDVIAMVKGKIYILLPFTSKQDAEAVVTRFFAKGMTLVPIEEKAEESERIG